MRCTTPLAYLVLATPLFLVNGCCYKGGCDPLTTECDDTCDDPEVDINGMEFYDCTDVEHAGFAYNPETGRFDLDVLINTKDCFVKDGMEVALWGMDNSAIRTYEVTQDNAWVYANGGSTYVVAGINAYFEWYYSPAWGFDAATIAPYILDLNQVNGFHDFALWCPDADALSCPVTVCTKSSYTGYECLRECAYMDGYKVCSDEEEWDTVLAEWGIPGY